MQAPRPLIRERDGSVALVTLARPPINALDREALEELGDLVGEVEADPGVRALVFASGIDGVFCSGGDLKYWREIHDAERRSAGQDARSLLRSSTRLSRRSRPSMVT